MEGRFNFTKEQESAIKHRSGSLLVSAAAGSGKTKVLVERLLSRIEEGDDVDEFLVITYTRAAASELREKIQEEIFKRLADAPGNRRLRRQSMLCRGAPIGTIHSFCTDILRENAHLAGLSPDFRVADESEATIIRFEVLEDVLNKEYETIETTEGFRALVDAISTGRDDRRLVEIILTTHAKLQSNPDTRAWAAKQIEELSMEGVTDVSETIWGAHLMRKTRGTTAFWLDEMRRARAEIKTLPDLEKSYGASVEETISGIESFQKALSGSWDEARRYSSVEFPRAGRATGYDDLKEIRSRCKAAMKKCAAVFECTSGEHVEDMLAVAPAMKELWELVLSFDHAYSAEKRRRGLVDFSDLEHLALSLLKDGYTGERTGLARTISGRFKEIMVDEYQDVNAVQESIFNAVSRDRENIFMVGDVKQSIYRFRLADPSIFLAKYRSFREADETTGNETTGNKTTGNETTGNETTGNEKGSSNLPEQSPIPANSVPVGADTESAGIRSGKPGKSMKPPRDGSKIHLSKNFRSRAGILNAVNMIFGKIMSVEFGEMDYTKREMLVPGREGDEEKDPAVEIDIIDMNSLEQDEDEENPEKARIEARHVANRIAELTRGEYTIPDGNGGRRRVEYSDIVILLRSIRDKAWIYASELSEREIPVDMPGGEGYFETVEISAALSLLSVIDNPMQDIPLASALRGPAYGFSTDELADIRSCSKGTDFYGALVKAAETGSVPDALNEKCAAFLADLEAMRMVMPDMPSDRFIWHVYNKTGLPGRVGAMRGGDRRRDNLILLAEYARGFEQNGYKGLFGFLTYIRGLQERGVELVHETMTKSQDSVRIMSIHKSKGLEFPVVILADTTKQFNNKDAQQSLLLHPVLGAGPMRMDRQRRIEYTTLARMAIRSKLTEEMMAEELRVLYVAMTRAREKLIITATFKDAEKELDRLSKLSGGNIAPQVLEDLKCTAGWMLLAVNSERLTVNSDRLINDIQINRFSVSEINDTTNEQHPCRGRTPGRPAEPIAVGAIHESPTPVPSPIDAQHPCRGRTPGRPAEPIAVGAIHESPAPAPSPADVKRIHDQLNFVYPYKHAADLPSKLTVTGLKGRQPSLETNTDAETAAFAKPQTERKQQFAFERPGFIAKKTGLTAAERGTALHLAMQYIDFEKCASADDVSGELKRLTDKGLLAEEQAAAVDIQKIMRFFESKIGKRMLKARDVKREFKFTLLYPAERYYPGGGDDKILLQGVIDCFFEEESELVLIDFKTDHVTCDTLAEKEEHYAPQLAAYSDALERITGKRVKERILYFFDL